MSFINFSNVKLYFEVNGEGPPLLLIHGLGSSSRDWEKQVEPLSEEFKVITIDLRGHGRSDKPPGPYSIRMFARDTAAVICELEIAPVHLVGISMGGMVAFELVVRFPELIKSLTVVNSYPEMRVESLHEHLQVWRRVLFLELLGMRGTGIMLGRHLFPKPGQSGLRDLFIERWAENDKRAYRESFRALLNWDVEQYLDKIKCPTLVVASDQDYMPLEEKRIYASKIPNANIVVIEDARHAVTAERPEKFNLILREFLVDLG